MNVHVSAALINKNGRLLAARRAYGVQQGGEWELPGGKVEEGETSVEALRRELEEELGMTPRSMWLYDTVEYDYPDFHLTMECFVCRIDADAEPARNPEVHSELRWLSRDELLDVAWLPADVELARSLTYYWDEAFSDQLL